MYVETLKSGKYRVGMRYKDAITGKWKKVSVTVDKNTKKELKIARELLEQKIKDLESSTDKEDITLSELSSLYLQDQKITTKYSSYVTRVGQQKTLIKVLGGDILINNINAGYVRKKLLQTGKSNKSLNNIIKNLKTTFKWAFKNDYASDISFLMKITYFNDEPESDSIEEKYLEQDEIEKLLSGIKSDKWKKLTKFLVLTGMRIGEAIALEIGDVDMKSKEITINKNYSPHSQTVSTTKTTHGTRKIHIQSELLPLIAELRSNALTEKMVTGSNLLFQNHGTYYPYSSYYGYIKRHGLRILGRHAVTPHVLRHTHVSMLATMGMTFEEIARRVGHKDSKTTKEIYFHVTRKLREKDYEKIDLIKIL